MRSALLCVFFTLIIQRGRIRAQNDDFRPTPIPLNEWNHERREGRAGTLHDTFKTDSPLSVAPIPAHYWEDALRHSVYLTLVRDKIDQLIAKGDVISPNSKHDSYDSKEIDDHDLWDKIKTAPFDRIQEEEPSSFGDVTIMAKGRLIEDNSGFRFVEDERTKEKCSREKCMDGVRAFWSVKRVRQRDQETSPGKYHYELTFSVISQLPKKQRKPYENPIRTFTVKESSPSGTMDWPQERRRYDPVSIQTPRPERAIWVHKNIAPSKSFTGRKQHISGLDRIFSSFFGDDDDRSYESSQPKYKQNQYSGQTGSQYSKIGHVGVSVDQHQVPYPYRPHAVHHARPPLPAPPTNPIQQQYMNSPYTTANSNPYPHYSYDHRVESSQAIKTTRPAVLPTPLPPSSPKDQTSDVTNTMSIESTAYTPMNMHKTYSKHKQTPMKMNYFTDHVRPPVYNAPPGVFVTMDKKPFKPMPPLKLVHSSKPHRTNKPIDFRPSPQIHDQSSEQGSFSDTAFRPITMNYGDNISPENSEVDYFTKKDENKNRKTTAPGKKPQKKHENIKSHGVTTAVPDIITLQSSSEEEIETMDWTNILGAFTKTTPMISQTEKMQLPDTTTHPTTTISTAAPKKITTSTEAVPHTTMSTSTTGKPKKRTRPPPKFAKQDKVKKHKRITTTTTTTYTPETVIKRRPLQDLIPQASSAATGTMKPIKESTDKTTLSSITTTTMTTTTTTKPTTTTLTTTTNQPPTTTKNSVTSTTQSRSKNRYRQSTLFYKGTSVKHDKWNSISMQKNQTTTNHPSVSHRRKGSNFQGYISSTTSRPVDEAKSRERNNHADRKLNLSHSEISTRASITLQPNINYEEKEDEYETNSVVPKEKLQDSDENSKNYNDESKDHAEYIFQSATTPTSYKSEEETAELDPTSYAPPKTKTKCKKKKNNQLASEDSAEKETESLTTMTVATTTTPKTSSETPTTNDILQELFNFNFKGNEDENSKYNSEPDLDEEESFNHKHYLKSDKDFDFLGVLNDNKEHRKSKSDEDDYEYENNHEIDDDDDDEDNSYEEESEESDIPSIDDDDDIEFDSEDDDETKTTRHTNIDTKQKKQPLSFLELMAMS